MLELGEILGMRLCADTVRFISIPPPLIPTHSKQALPALPIMTRGITVHPFFFRLVKNMSVGLGLGTFEWDFLRPEISHVYS